MHVSVPPSEMRVISIMTYRPINEARDFTQETPPTPPLMEWEFPHFQAMLSCAVVIVLASEDLV